MAYHFKIPQDYGFHKNLVSPDNSDIKYISLSYAVSKDLLKIKENTGNKEWLVVILKGGAEVIVNKKVSARLQRKNVFDDDPCAVYISRLTDFQIDLYPGSEILAVSAPVSGDFSSRVITPDKIREKRVGKENYYRNIRDIMPEEFPAGRIIAGETINDDGNWSSFPPHKHDRDKLPEEVKLEELYFFKLFPEKTGYGIIRVYDEKDDNLFLLKNNEVVTIPKGYHPVAVIPGHKIYYFWALAGKKRTLKPNTHSDFKYLL